MVLRALGALFFEEASAPYLRHFSFQRRRKCSSSGLCHRKLKLNEPLKPADISSAVNHQRDIGNGSNGLCQKRQNHKGASLTQQDDCNDGSNERLHEHQNCKDAASVLWPQHDCLEWFQQSHLQTDRSLDIPQGHEQHDKSTSISENPNHSGSCDLWLSFDHSDTTQQSGVENSNICNPVGVWKRGEQQCSLAPLWEEKEQVLYSFSSRYSGCSTKEQGDTFSDEDDKSGLLFSLCREGHLDSALEVLFCMDPAPPMPVYLFLLGECSKNKAPVEARKVCAHFDHHNQGFAELIAEFLVLSISQSAQNVRCTSCLLPCLSVFAWSTMISALVENGYMKEALRMMWRMLEDGAEPSSYIFVSLIKACSITKDLWHGMKLHAAAFMKGIASHLIVGSTLVSMYGKCGAILEAENVFNTLYGYDVVSCNAMLAAFVDVGQGERALLLYRQMHAEGMHWNHGSFVIALQACRSLAELEEAQFVQERSIKMMSLEIGQALHSAIRRAGFTVDAFINNTLVNMYGKIGAVVEAELVFDTLSNRDTISWNAMLSTYVENNQGHNALWLYRIMVQEDVSVDALTCVFALKACEIIADDEQAVVVEGQTVKVRSLRLGQALHLDSCTMGFASDVFLGTALISTYGKCGAIMEAEDVFLSLMERDIVAWNAVLSAYIEQDKGGKALRLFRQMQEYSVGANSQTFVFALQACANLAEVEEAIVVEGKSVKAMALDIGQALHGFAIRNCSTNSFVCNTLVSMYGNCGRIVEAEHVFVALSQPDVVSWNVMLSAYVEQGQGVPALQMFRLMQEKGTAPNHLTFVFALQACGILAESERAVSVEGMLKKVVSLEIGCALHKDALGKGFTSDAYVGNTLLSMYGKCGDVTKRDDLFTSLHQHDIVSWNAMLSMCVEQGKAEQVLWLFKQLEEQWIISDDATLVSALQACSITGCLLMSEQVHFSIVSAGYDQSPSIAATLLYAYGSCARIEDVQVLFNELMKGDVVSWNAVIAGHLGEDNIARTIHLYEEMTQTGIDPDEVTFTSVLSACSHFGLVVNGFEFFKCMSGYYGMCPNLRHYGAVIDLFGRAGDFKRVQILLERMPWKPDLPIALCLLGASRTHGNLKLAEWAFNHAVRLQPKQPTAYVLMSNIYADN